MRPRVAVAILITRFSNLLRSLPVAIMRPDDLVEFNRQIHGHQRVVELWGEESYLRQGLTTDEKGLLEKVPLEHGRVLNLGGGGGREAIILAQKGFEVLLVDYIPELVEQAKTNAAHFGVNIDGLAQEITQLEVPPQSFELAVLLGGMYSCIPTKARRIATLRRINQALKPGGYFVVQFLLTTHINQLVDIIFKAVAYLTLGNFWYEKGDRILQSDFFHNFLSEEELRDEFQTGGFELLHFMPASGWSGAILRRRG